MMRNALALAAAAALLPTFALAGGDDAVPAKPESPGQRVPVRVESRDVVVRVAPDGKPEVELGDVEFGPSDAFDPKGKGKDFSPGDLARLNDFYDASFSPFAGWLDAGSNSVTVDLNIDDATVRDALKRVFEPLKLTYAVDDDVPGDVRISVKAKNVRLGTALDLITQAAGVGWTFQPNGAGIREAIPKKPKLEKKGAGGEGASNDFGISGDDLDYDVTTGRITVNGNVRAFAGNKELRSDRIVVEPRSGSGDANGPAVEIKPPVVLSPEGLAGNKINGRLSGTYRIGKSVKRGTLFNLRNQMMLDPNVAIGNKMLPYLLQQREERSTFTCPHCKAQTTMVRVRQQPKCPKCSRVFQDDWQYCPADGSKRPAPAAEWKYCPACGKQVQPEKSDSGGNPLASYRGASENVYRRSISLREGSQRL